MERKSALGLALLLLAVLLLSLSCATGSGSTYSSSLDSDRKAAERSAEAKARAEASRPQPPPSSGAGEDSASSLVFALAPREPTGLLILEGLPPGSSVYVDGSFRLGRAVELGLGSHEILVTCFGRESWSGSVFIAQDARVSLKPELWPASFALTGASADPPSFDPSNPGLTGSTRIIVEASAPGELELAVYDAGGGLRRRLEGVRILSSRTSLAWDGRDGGGRRLASGDYRVEIEGRGEDGLVGRASLLVRIAPGSPRRYWLPLSGLSGPLLAPDAQTLSAGSFQAGAALLAHLAEPGVGLASTLPLSAGLRLGLSERSELSFAALGVIRTASLEALSSSWASGTVSWKRRLGLGDPGGEAGPGGGFRAALALKAGFRSFLDEKIAYWPPAWDGPTNFGGLSVALPLEGEAGGLRAFLAPELILSTFYPGWDDERWEVPSLFSWAYLRAGAEARLSPDLVLALSAALRTEPLGLGEGLLDLALPLSGAAELHYYLDDGTVLSAYALAELGGVLSYAIYGGFGIGFAR